MPLPIGVARRIHPVSGRQTVQVAVVAGETASHRRPHRWPPAQATSVAPVSRPAAGDPSTQSGAFTGPLGEPGDEQRPLQPRQASPGPGCGSQ